MTNMTAKTLSFIAASTLIIATLWVLRPRQISIDVTEPLRPLAPETMAAYKIRILPIGFGDCTFCDGDRLLACSGNDVNLIRVADAKAGRTLKGYADSVQYLSATRSLLSVDPGPGIVTVWDTDSWQAKKRLAVEQEIGPPKPLSARAQAAEEDRPRNPKLGRAVASPDGRLLAAVTYEDHHLKVWNLATGQLVHDLGEVHHGEHIQAVAFSPDGRTLASVGYDKRVAVFNVPDWKQRASWSCTQELAWLITFAPDSNVIATASSDAKVRVWDLDGKPKAVFELLPGAFATFIFGAAFSPDGRFLAVGGGFTSHVGAPGLVAVWDWRQHREVFRLQPSTSASAICFSASQKWLAWGGSTIGLGNIMPWPPAGVR